jgi:hypothetical protein
MASLITDSMFEAEIGVVPGRYAKDITVGLLLASGAMFVASMISFIFDGWQNCVFLMLMSIWLELLYICVEKRG